MKKLTEFIIKKKFFIIIAVLLIAVFSALIMNRVSINYSNSDYLPKDTDTARAITIIEDEFGINGNIQIMVTNISLFEADNIKAEIENIEGVKSVSFISDSTLFYKDNNALYVISSDSSDYSERTTGIVNNLKVLMESNGYTYNLAGSAIEKDALMDAITSELPYILIVCVALATIILLITSSSWIEPFLFLLVSGIGIVINRGTNIIFGEVSYITSSVAAILQLALSMDYGIVLLHTFHDKQKEIKSNKEAMQAALISTMSPISASALTTIAGLLALLFMTFRIGFDIGMVLSKGILISAILAFTLLPGVILIFDKLMIKTKKKPFIIKARFLSKIALKRYLIILPVAFILIITGGILRTLNSYSFADSKLDKTEIVQTFGYNNPLVILYPKTAESSDLEKEKQFIDLFYNYDETHDKVLTSYVASINTFKQSLSIEEAALTTGIDIDNVKDLFALYHINENEDDYKLDFETFMTYSKELIENDSSVSAYITNDTANLIKTLCLINDLTKSDNSYQELNDFLSNDLLKEFPLISGFYLRQLYGLYNYENQLVNIESIKFIDLLDYIIYANDQYPEIREMFDSDLYDSLVELDDGLHYLIDPITKTEFKSIMSEDYGMSLSDAYIDTIYQFYFDDLGLPVENTIPLVNLLKLFVDQSLITNASEVTLINKYYDACSNYVTQSFTYDNFFSALDNVVLAFTDNNLDTDISSETFRQLYISYYYDYDLMPDTSVKGSDLIQFILDQKDESVLIKDSLTNSMIVALNDVLTIYSVFENKTELSPSNMVIALTNLSENIDSITFDEAITSNQIIGVYTKYVVAENLDYQDEIYSSDLIDFVALNMESNTLISQSIDASTKQEILDTKNLLDSTETSLIGNNYKRIIINLNLENDSQDSYDYAKYLSESAKSIFGNNTYIAGEIMSTKDLRDSFRHDVTLISIMTVVSMLAIILIIYRSISLPVILVLIIQGSIWITMSTAFVFGKSIFFMSYIIATCILMGATIDYGILISSKYLDARNTLDKKEAINHALSKALPSIFTSGSILIVCGFTVFLISTQVSISTTGLLLGIGSTFSLIMVLFVLPSILYIFDSIIIKTTLKSKSNK